MSQAAAMPRDLAVPPARAGGRLRRRLRLVLMGGGVLVVAAGAVAFWLDGGRWVSIDNAYANADKVALSTDVSGEILDVAVHEGEAVRKGAVLFRLDPQQFDIAVRAARADLAETLLTLEAGKRDYGRMLRDVATRSAQVEADRATFERDAALVGRGDMARQAYDDARFKLEADRHALESGAVAAQVQLARLDGDPDVDVRTLPMALQAQARLEEAERQLDHATVRAPFDGVVTQVPTLQPGMFLPAGTAAFGLVSTDHVWVDANPKETELTHVRPGDPVRVTVDTYPGRVWDGTVESISPGSGSQFSILPAQNASGNWVKVVQRIPVRIRVERQAGDPPLRAGMSVVADVDTGHTRSLRDLY